MEHGSANVIGARVRQLRKKAGLTQSDLVARCQVVGLDISRVALALIEGGARRVNDYEVHLIAVALRVAISDLFPKVPQRDFRKRLNPPGPRIGSKRAPSKLASLAGSQRTRRGKKP
jgi:transcriptional regulator with XRE-family HTH domain